MKPDCSAPQTSLWSANFAELFSRHLCRHGEFGINVLHLIAVYGIYLSVYALVSTVISLTGPELNWRIRSAILFAASGPYLILMFRNLSGVVLLLVVVSILSLCVFGTLVSVVPWWLHLLLIPAWHRVQLWSHRIYRREKDMTLFAEKYPKGMKLFVLLSVYELPILLNFFLKGDRESQSTGNPANSVSTLTA